MISMHKFLIWRIGFCERYPQKVVNEQIDIVVFGKQPSHKDTSAQGVPFVATYNPRLGQS